MQAPLCRVFRGGDMRERPRLVTGPTNPLPGGVRAIAALFASCAVYLCLSGLLMIVRPGLLGMSVGAPLLFGLELAGPYMFLLMAAVAGAIACGLMRRNNITRHAAILIAIAGVVMLVPAVSAARSVPRFRWRRFRNRTVPRFHCFQIMDRNLRRIHFCNRCNTEGVWQKPK